MLSDDDILLELANQRRDVPLNVVTTFTDSRSERTLNERVFKSKLLPVSPPLCFFEPDPAHPGTYSLTSFCSDVDPNYTIVPFGSKLRPADIADDFGISYNAFYGEIPLQSYTICKDAENVPKRGSDQTDYFKEMSMNDGMWSAGHMIAHRYTPVFESNDLASTLQYKWNFIPEPHYWNCYQRNHLENRCADGYYGVYPMYNLRYVHGRTVKPYGPRGKRLPYRPIPDGEFFIGNKQNGDRFSVYMPFVVDSMKVYDSKVYHDAKCKLDITLNAHKITRSAMPQSINVNFEHEIAEIVRAFDLKISADERLSLAQGNIFADSLSNPLHHAAVIQRERAAAIEYKTPRNKMYSAIIFSNLGNQKKTKTYLKAVNSHAKFLLDTCKGEDPSVPLFSNRLFNDFIQKFTDEDQTIDVLNRLKFHSTH